MKPSAPTTSAISDCSRFHPSNGMGSRRKAGAGPLYAGFERRHSRKLPQAGGLFPRVGGPLPHKGRRLPSGSGRFPFWTGRFPSERGRSPLKADSPLFNANRPISAANIPHPDADRPLFQGTVRVGRPGNPIGRLNSPLRQESIPIGENAPPIKGPEGRRHVARGVSPWTAVPQKFISPGRGAGSSQPGQPPAAPREAIFWVWQLAQL